MADGSRVAAVVRLMESLMIPSDKNCSERMDTPSAREFLTNLEPFQVVLLAIAGAFTFVVCSLALVHWYYVYSFVSVETRRNKLYWLITLFPVSTACCLVGMLAPRTSLIMTALGILYYLMCLFVIVSLCRRVKPMHLFGGRSSFSNSLRFDARPIDFRSPPFCCLLPYLPTAKSSEKNIRRLEWLVLQAPVVRALIIVSDIIAVAEMREAAKTFLRYSDIFSVGSLLLAIFGVHTLARVTSNKLSDYCFMTVFRFVDVSLLFFTAQQPMLFQNILVRFDLIKCGRLLTAQENATFVCNFVIICEMFVLSLLATVLLAPRKNAMFDNYRMLKTPTSLHDADESDMASSDILQFSGHL
uniref:Organic solute transporter alpha-like protein 3 n=1 Tax=Angiostrongylus cantonensis TaxID=6313 RepID=A0A158PAX8_ANGCA